MNLEELTCWLAKLITIQLLVQTPKLPRCSIVEIEGTHDEKDQYCVYSQEYYGASYVIFLIYVDMIHI